VNDEPPWQRRLNNIMINNTRHVGNFHVFHRASPSDGQMDALLTEQRFGQQMLHNLSLLTPISLYDSSKDRRRARCLFLRSSAPARLMLDGETWDNVDEVTFAVLSQRLVCYSRLT
jgi:diacylglycerol kinase family enzyme